MTPLAAFITGLTTGGLTCLAVQGGLLLGLLAQREKNGEKRRWQQLIAPVGAFLIAKTIAYIILGLGLGLLGSKLQISPTVQHWLQAIAALFIIIAGIRLFFPSWLPWLTFQPPYAIRRLVRQSATIDTWFAPAVLGFLTILIPCGTTQAMEIAAVATGSAAQAAAIMGAFVIGTAPLFFIIGILAKGTVLAQRKLTAVAALIVIGLGLYSMNGVLVAIDSPYSFQNEMTSIRGLIGGGPAEQTASAAVTIKVMGSGYSPNRLTVPAGQPVQLTLQPQGSLGCTSVFLIPKINLQEDLLDGTKKVTATFPTPGEYRFTCGMGMYSGVIEAI